ncbi:MAG: hypothetical protein KIT10_04940 [Flavobacteriales bacterium]|nr:hypothetical protein [Flavobacteriales bacterium]
MNALRTLLLGLVLPAIFPVKAFGQDLVVDLSFNPGGTNFAGGLGVLTLALQPDGKILCGGFYQVYNGVPRTGICRLHPDGTLDLPFDPVLNSSACPAVFVQTNGHILIGGGFTVVDGELHTGLARLDPFGNVDQSFLSQAAGKFHTVAVAPNGRVFGGGTISSPMAGYVVLYADGGLNTQPPVSSADQQVLQPDGRILVGSRDWPYLFRMEQDGFLDPTFSSSITTAFDGVLALHLMADGRAMIGGGFSAVDGQPRSRIARVSSTGSLDPSFDPGTGFDQDVTAIEELPDGDLLVAGWFTSYNGVALNGSLVRLAPDGALVTSYAASNILDIQLQPDGKVLLSGGVISFNGTQRSGIMRLMPDPGTGMSEAALGALKVWPNPVSHVLHLAGIEGPYRYVVLDGMGRTVLTGSGAGTALYAGTLPVGAYTLEVRDARGVRRARIIKA